MGKAKKTNTDPDQILHNGRYDNVYFHKIHIIPQSEIKLVSVNMVLRSTEIFQLRAPECETSAPDTAFFEDF